jgi:hypothetical protein
MCADIKAFAINAASRKTFILHCKYVETFYLCYKYSVDNALNRKSSSCKRLAVTIKYEK